MEFNWNNLKIGLQNESSTASDMYNELNAKIERFSKLFYFAMARFTLIIATVPPFLSSMFNFFVRDMADDAFQDLYLMYVVCPTRILSRWKCFNRIDMNILMIFRAPFNWKTPIGYTFLIFFNTAAIFCLIICIIPIDCLLIANCWAIICFIKDIGNDLPLLSIGGRSKRNRSKVKQRLCDILQPYLDVKQLSDLIYYCHRISFEFHSIISI